MNRTLSLLLVALLVLPTALRADGELFFVNRIDQTDDVDYQIVRANADASSQTVIHTTTDESDALGTKESRFGDIEVDPDANKLYFVEQVYENEAFVAHIRRMNFDGSEIETVISDVGIGVLLSDSDIALDLEAKKIYWSDRRFSNLNHVDFDGTNLGNISGVPGLASFIGGIATNSNGTKAVDPPLGDVFFALNGWSGVDDEFGNGVFYPGLSSNSPGSFIDVGPIDENAQVMGVVLDGAGRTLYFAEFNPGPASQNFIKRVDLPNFYGEEVVTPQAIVSDINQPYELALDLANGKIYWIEFNRTGIFRSNLDGSSQERLLDKTSGVDPYRMALVGEKTETTLTFATELERAPTVLNVGGGGVFRVTMKEFNKVAQTAKGKRTLLRYELKARNTATGLVKVFLVKSHEVEVELVAGTGYTFSYHALGVVKKRVSREAKKKLRKRISKLSKRIRKAQKLGKDSTLLESKRETLRRKLKLKSFEIHIKTNESPTATAP